MIIKNLKKLIDINLLTKILLAVIISTAFLNVSKANKYLVDYSKILFLILILNFILNKIIFSKEEKNPLALVRNMYKATVLKIKAFTSKHFTISFITAVVITYGFINLVIMGKSESDVFSKVIFFITLGASLITVLATKRSKQLFNESAEILSKPLNPVLSIVLPPVLLLLSVFVLLRFEKYIDYLGIFNGFLYLLMVYFTYGGVRNQKNKLIKKAYYLALAVYGIVLLVGALSVYSYIFLLNMVLLIFCFWGALMGFSLDSNKLSYLTIFVLLMTPILHLFSLGYAETFSVIAYYLILVLVLKGLFYESIYRQT